MSQSSLPTSSLHLILKSILVINFLCLFNQLAMANEDMYPRGLRVLLVDDNIACLHILEKLLQTCQYNVTITNEAVVGLQMLRENFHNFDIVISDVHMHGMDGFTLLEHISMEFDIPVIMMSANEDLEMVMEGVKKGAVDYLLKPARLLELKNIWQHVVRRNVQKQQKGKGVVKALSSNNTTNEEEEDKQQEEESLEDPIVKKKAKDRFVWCPILHKKFLDALNSLGSQRAYPKKILEHMNVKGLTRENVASHLQKYRLNMKKFSAPPNTPFGQSTYHNIYGGSLLRSRSSFINGDRPLRSAASLVRMLNAFPRSNLSQSPSSIEQRLHTSTSLDNNSNFMEINPSWTNNNNYYYNNNQNDHAVAPLERPIDNQLAETFTNPIPQQDQSYFANFMNVVSNIGATQFQTPMVDPQARQQNINVATNVSVGLATYNNDYNPAIGSSIQDFGDFNDNIGPIIEQLSDDLGLMEDDNNVGLTIEQLSDNSDIIKASFIDGFSIDENFNFNGSGLLVGLTNNDGGTLKDMVVGYPN